MKKLIEVSQDKLIECDNPKCNYTINNICTDQLAVDTMLLHYINKPCPICGENLLTKEDYIQSVKLTKIVNFLNKYFSWITIFFSDNIKNQTNVEVHVHNGVKFKEIKDEKE